MKYLYTAILLVCFYVAHSQDRLFAYTYQSNVLNKGDFDLEFMNTLSTGKVGAYSPYIFGQHLDQRLEFETGLGKNVMTAFYLNSERFDFALNGDKGISSEQVMSFSNEWKWKLADPVANGMGFALYEELEFGGHNIEFETKLIFDKRWQNDLFALNLVNRYEIERVITIDNGTSKAKWESTSPLEADIAYMHFIKPEIGVGLELLNINDINKNDGWINSVVFVGPAFHVSLDKFFINLSALPQISNLHKTDLAPGSRDLNDFEAFQARVLVGYSF